MQAIVALGSNVAPAQGGTCADTIRAAMAALPAPGTRVLATSRLWQTPCMPVGAGPDYVNAAALLETTLTARGLLDHLHAIEAQFDRARTGRWAARTLDLDLIDHGGAILPDRATQARWRALPPARQSIDAPDQLITPHPRLQDRAFVLVPMADVAPQWRDPVTGTPLRDLLAALPEADRAAVKPLQDTGAAAPKGLSSISE